MNLPGPRPHLLVGNLPEFGRDILGFFTNCARFGDIVPLRLGQWPAVFINHPDHFDHVLLENSRNFIKHTFFFRHVTEIFGAGLLTNEGGPWLRQRRLMQPAFHRDRVAGYGATMVEYAERMLAEWDAQAAGERDLHGDMMLLTMEIATKTLFGEDMAEKTAAEISSAFNDAVAAIAVRFRRPVKIPGWIPTPSNLRYSSAVKRLDRLIYGFIEEKKRNGTGNDLLSMLMEARDEDGSAMDEKQIRDEAITIFLAGHETTALSLFWTFHLLAQNHEVEERLAGEIARHDGDLTRCPYLMNVVSESMRLYPPAYAIGREAVGDFEIGGVPIPAGTTVFMSPWVSHRDPRWFDDPLSFRPQRWDNDLARRLPRFAYFPFGGGPRVCIGNSFALMEAALILGSIVRRYRVTHAGAEPVPYPSITLRPKHATRMAVEMRE
ncbi:MAG TPA: cytochrome P450 [Thermoanaerobaculia bacterium]|nr:cytochrome P450 [Thermoanaerobaculia bacterium]